MKRHVLVSALFAITLAGTMGGHASDDRDGVWEIKEMAAEVAQHYLERRELGEFNLRRVFLDKLGQAHVRLDQLYQEIPVFEGQMIVHVDLASGAVRGVTDARKTVGAVDVEPDVTAAAAERIARRLAGVGAKANAQTTLVVLVSEDRVSHLAWRVRVLQDSARGGPVDWMAFVDAHDREVLLSYNNLHTDTVPALGLANTLYAGTVSLATESYDNGGFGMRDPTRGGNYTIDMLDERASRGILFVDADNVWGNFTNEDRATAGSDAHFAATVTLDYYAKVHGRDGVFDDPTKSVFSRVHYGDDYVNAFWFDACECMTYGDGDGVYASPLVSLDIVAHEMTHGVTAAEVELTYKFESGALSESLSDIFATAVEFYAADYSAQVPDYWLGEDVWTPTIIGDALRYMDHPKWDGRSIDHYSLYTRNMDVHYSSGLANNVFYLLSEGGTNDTSGIKVAPIGRDKAAAVFYQAVTAYMTPDSNFAKAKEATMDAATELYGLETAVLVGLAWEACGVF